MRARGTDLPIWIGLPGVVDYAKLVRISMKIGLGESARFLGHHHGWMSRLLTTQFKPDRLLRGSADRCRPRGLGVAASTSTRSTRWSAPSAGGAQTLEDLAEA